MKDADAPIDRSNFGTGHVPDYHVPLDVAYRWNRGDETRSPAAEQLLNCLIERYPAALHVWYEWAFNRAKQGRFDEAMKSLRRIDEIFGDAIGEDVYSLWGRCCKEAGDRYLENGRSCQRGSAEQRSAFEEADDAYAPAVPRYQQAYELQNGFFPGINLATLLFLRAGLNACLACPAEAASLRRQLSSDLATSLHQSKLLEKLPDDSIWRRATQAEAAILQSRLGICRSAISCRPRSGELPSSPSRQHGPSTAPLDRSL